jgi:hypothetical protein
MKQRNLSQLPTYVKTPTEVTDKEVLREHPVVKMWEEVIPYLVHWHPEYSICPQVRQVYNESV